MHRKTSREILAESFHELMETKPADRITVQEIAENCGYSPATFYRQFRDKYDLIAWDYSKHCERIMNPSEESDRTWEQSVRDGCRYLESQKSYLSNLLKHTGGQDSFFQYMATINEQMLEKEVQKKSGGRSLGGAAEIAVRIFSYGTAYLLCEWLIGERNDSMEVLPDLIIQALPEVLVPYLR